MRCLTALLFAVLLCTAHLAALADEPRPRYRPLNGSYRQDQPALGTPFQLLNRLNIPYNYTDGIGAINPNLPNPREISNLLISHKPASGVLSKTGKSQLNTGWGMIVMHDIARGNNAGGQSAPIVFPKPDPVFNVYPANPDVYYKQSFFRSIPQEGSGVTTPRAQTYGATTPFLDATPIYGLNEAALATVTNTSSKGRLLVKSTPFGDMLPVGADGVTQFSGQTLANLYPPEDALLTILFREHNRKADELAKANPSWDSATVLQEARRWTIAVYQAITFNEYYPAIMGQPMRPYRGYNPEVKPSLLAPFYAAVVRMGHSELSSVIRRKDQNLNTIPQGDVVVRDVTKKPNKYLDQGIEPILLGAVSELADEVDNFYEEDFRSYGTGTPFHPTTPALDIAAASIQRDRDFGFPNYNVMRELFGLPRKQSFAEIHSDPQIQAILKQLYGDVDNVEFYIGGITEEHPGKHLGELFGAIFSQQLHICRDSDPYYYKNPDAGFSRREIAELDSLTLSKLILRNTDIERFPCDALYASSELRCRKNNGRFDDDDDNDDDHDDDHGRGHANRRNVNAEENIHSAAGTLAASLTTMAVVLASAVVLML
eukprot:GEZU01032541.1.p1 GENE.GEZU01032541.1~~GEZU01032541.1.p1  ORF type:complete len:600 (-),score=217.02 GEZU01032541.1:70-1869(-)